LSTRRMPRAIVKKRLLEACSMLRPHRRQPAPWFAAMALLTSLPLAIGCGENKPKLVPVTVTVTYPDKKPVAGAQVVFRSTDANASARGVTGEDGKCQLTTFQANDGAAPGRHVVLIAEPPLMGDPDVPQKGPKIADRFASSATSDLEAVVKDDGSENSFSFTVTQR
jgi:hypothetical protein